MVEHIEVGDGALIGDVAFRSGSHLVEYRQGVAHGTVSLLGNHVQRRVFGGDAFLRGDVLQLLHDVVHGDAREIVDLAAAEYGGYDFVLLGGGEDEDGMRRRLLERLEESVERLLREHVHLVDDEHAVAANLRRNAHLVDEVAYVVNRVVRCGVELHDVVAALLVECHARFALVASLAFGGGIQAVDGLGKDAGTRSLAHASRSAEQIGVRQTVALDCRLQGVGESLLPNHAAKRGGTVFSG